MPSLFHINLLYTSIKSDHYNDNIVICNLCSSYYNVIIYLLKALLITINIAII